MLATTPSNPVHSALHTPLLHHSVYKPLTPTPLLLLVLHRNIYRQRPPKSSPCPSSNWKPASRTPSPCLHWNPSPVPRPLLGNLPVYLTSLAQPGLWRASVSRPSSRIKEGKQSAPALRTHITITMCVVFDLRHPLATLAKEKRPSSNAWETWPGRLPESSTELETTRSTSEETEYNIHVTSMSSRQA